MRKSRRYTVLTLIIILILMVPVLGVLTLNEAAFFSEEILTDTKDKISALEYQLNLMDSTNNLTLESIREDMENHLKMMSTALGALIKKNKYTGPRTFDGGAVAEIRNGEIILPDEISDPFRNTILEALTNDPGDKSVLDKIVMLSDEEAEAAGFTIENDEDEQPAGQDTGNGMLLNQEPGISPGEEEEIEETAAIAVISYMQFAPGFYYVEWTDYQVYANYFDKHADYTKIFSAVEEAYGGGILFFTNDDEDLTLFYGSEVFSGCRSAKELGITKEFIDARETVLRIDRTTYLCSYLESSLLPEYFTLMILQPTKDLRLLSAVRSLFAVGAIAIVLILTAVYLLSVRSFVAEHILDEEQKELYKPYRLRRRITAVGIAGCILVFIFAAFINTVGRLRDDTDAGNQKLRILNTQIRENADTATRESIQAEETWYVHYAERLVSLIQDRPELGAPDMLRKYCSDLNVDYITWYDNKGNEKACSSGYSGLRLGNGQGADSADFRRLKNGVPSIVHPPSEDPVTGLERQYIGVSFPSSSATDLHESLILALDPERTRRTVNAYEINKQIGLFTEDAEFCFIADEDTGTILYADDEKMLGSTVMDLGLQEKSLRDGFLDFAAVNAVPCFVNTSEYDGWVYYYAAPQYNLFKNAFIYGGSALLCFVILFTVLTVILLRGYTDEEYEKWAVVGKPAVRGSVVTIIAPDGTSRRTVDPSRRWSFTTNRWADRFPEEKTRSVFMILLLITVLLTAIRLNYGAGGGAERDNITNFIVHGKWMRGINLFALCASLITCSAAFVISFFSRRFLQLISGFTGSKGETVCRLLYDFIQYLLVFVCLYYIFGYMGINTNAILASLGLITLALTLGSKDMVTDIIAGIFIVFEGEFQVGDIVDVGGYRGVVQEIGVRSTKIIGRGDNVKIIGNQDIKNVINLTRLNSWVPLEIRVGIDEPLEEMEEMLGRELPKIGSRYKEIISGPLYKGIIALGGGTMTLSVITECKEADYHEVQRIISKEIRALFLREGIQLK